MVVSVLEQLSHGGEINYDGEDRDWLLTLTSRVRHHGHVKITDCA